MHFNSKTPISVFVKIYKYISWPCKWIVTMHICTVTIYRVNDFFILFFSPLSTSNLPHSLFLISILTSLSPINSLSKLISLSDQIQRWFRQTMILISLSHLRSHKNDRLSQQTMIRRSKALTQWMSVIPTSLFYLIVDGGWVWVILGLCWVCSSTKKTVAGWVWVILLKDGCGCGLTEKTSLWVCFRGKEIIKNVKRMNILLNKFVE